MRAFYSRSLKWDAQPRQLPKKPHPGNPLPKKLFVRQQTNTNSSKALSHLAASEKALLAPYKKMAAAHKLYVKTKKLLLRLIQKSQPLRPRLLRPDH
jgi:hypothetical protein